MNGTVLAGLIATVITVGGGYLTNRSSTRTLAKSQDNTSRTDIERDAFTRAESFYKNTIAEQDSQIAELKVDLAAEKRERVAETTSLRVEMERLRVDLRTAKHTIRRLRGNDG